MKKSHIALISALAVVIGLTGIAAASLSSSFSTTQVTKQDAKPTSNEPSVAQNIEVPLEAENSKSSTEDLLLYLIEEEKLAHDVYQVLGETWGDKIFVNILTSETSHQDQVLNLLNAYGLPDPRSTEIGTFNNPELQALYDQLISQGMSSDIEAYKVGVLIEQTDIADLSTAISATTDPVILSTLEKLRSASENHLNAFSKKN